MDSNILANDKTRFLDMIAYLSIYALDHKAGCDIGGLHNFLIETLRVPHLDINKLDYLICDSEKYSRYFDSHDPSHITLSNTGKTQLIVQRYHNASLSVSIYRIYCAATERSYIGQARDPDSRWQQHLRELRIGKHRNKALQEDFAVYGEAEFSVNILAENIPLYLSCNYEHYHCQEYDDIDTPVYNVGRIELKLNSFNGCKLDWF